MVGQTILQYQLLQKLGAGGMGEVFKAQDTRLNRVVAIKVLPAAMSADADRRRRFLQEAQAASGLNHPNIITIYDIVSDGDAQYMVMEYVPGKTLGEIVHSGGLPVLLALQYSTQMSDALSTAHAAGIIHRDLKPANVMVTPTGLVKILDFGLAKLMDAGPVSQFDMQSTAAEPLTREGAIIGTASYMSPEQAEGKRVDARSDIFSFGSVLYEMVTGRRAFDGGSGISTLSAVLRDEVKPIPDLAPQVPLLFEQIIAMCLRKDPNARWQTMKEVENALNGLKRQLDPGVKPSPPPVPATTAAATGPSLPPPLPPRPAAAVPPAVPPPLPSKPSAPAPVAAMPPPVPVPIPIATSKAAAPPPVPTKPAATAATPPPVPGKTTAPLPVGAIAPPPAKSKSSTGVLVLLLIVLLLVGGGAAGAWWWWQQQHKPVPETAAQVAPPPTVAPTPAPVVPAPEPVTAEPAATAPVETALTNDAVLQMVQAKVPISQINQQIRSSKTNFTLTPEEISRLRKAGVPNSVIQVMRNPKAVATPPPTVAGSSPPTVTTTTTPPPVPPPARPATSPRTSPETAAAPRRPVIQTVPVTINDALPFRIVLNEDVAANGQEGQALRFTVVDGFKVGDTVVIPPGATVTGSITSEAGKKFLGMGNKMTFRLLQADAVDGQKISVRSKSGKQPNGPTTRPFDTGKNPKSKGLAAAQGTEYIAYIDGEQTVSVRK
jgi:serine/threonine protein kinase/flagellar basal body-associated protein FliL